MAGGVSRLEDVQNELFKLQKMQRRSALEASQRRRLAALKKERGSTVCDVPHEVYVSESCRVRRAAAAKSDGGAREELQRLFGKYKDMAEASMIKLENVVTTTTKVNDIRVAVLSIAMFQALDFVPEAARHVKRAMPASLSEFKALVKDLALNMFGANFAKICLTPYILMSILRAAGFGVGPTRPTPRP